MEKLIIVGIGSQSLEIVDLINRYNLFSIVGFAVNKKYLVERFMDRPVYPIESLESFVDKETTKLFVAISYYNRMNKYKRATFEELKNKGFHFANIISPHASLRCKSIGEGNLIMDYAVIGYNATIGDNNYIASGSLISHNTHIGSHNVLGGKACLSGRVEAGNQIFFGVNCTIFDHVTIGDKCLIGGGAVVKKSIDSFTVVSSPDAIYKQSKEKYIEMFLSPEAIDVSHNV